MRRERRDLWWRGVGIVVVVALAAACSGGGGGTASEPDVAAAGSAPSTMPPTLPPTTVVSTTAQDDPGTSTPPTTTGVEALVVPPPPAGTSFAGSPAEQATAILDGLADPAGRPAATLGAFAATGLPVLAGDGGSITTAPDDVFGMPWPVLWAAAQPTAAVGLVGAMRLFGLALTGEAEQAEALAEAGLAGLQDALTDVEPAVQVLAATVAESARRTRGADLVTAGPDQELFVDPVVAAMVLTSAQRGVMAGVLEASLPGGPVGDSVLFGRALARAEAFDTSKCSSSGAGWAAYALSKVTGGLAGVGSLGSTGGWFQRRSAGVLDTAYQRVAGAAGAEILGKMSTVFGAASNVTALLTALASRKVVHALDPTELKRTKSTTKHGDPGGVTFTISSEMQPDAANCALLILSALGNSTLLQSDFVGVEVLVEGRTGFEGSGGYVLLGGEVDAEGRDVFAKVKADADANGMVRFAVQGRAQAKEVPLGAPGYQRPFSLFAEAALSPNDGNAVLKTALDSLLCASQLGGGGKVTSPVGGVLPLAGCSDAVADVMSQFHWDLGEYDFQITDWQRGLQADVVVQYQDVTGGEVTRFTLVAARMELVPEPAPDGSTIWRATVKPELVDATNNLDWTGGPWINESGVTVEVVQPPSAPGTTPGPMQVVTTLTGGVAYPWDDETQYFAHLFDGFSGTWASLGGTTPRAVDPAGGTASFTLAGPSHSNLREGTEQYVATVTLTPTS